MERRLFVKKTSMLTAGIIAMPSLTSYATHENEISSIDLVPFLSSKKIKIKGTIIDALSLQPISNVSMKVKLDRNRFLSSERMIESIDGKYNIFSGFNLKGKFSEKIEVEIKADGYKTYNGQLHLSQIGCNIHSDEWNYNPDFKSEFVPKNVISGDDLVTQFNFRLVR